AHRRTSQTWPAALSSFDVHGPLSCNPAPPSPSATPPHKWGGPTSSNPAPPSPSATPPHKWGGPVSSKLAPPSPSATPPYVWGGLVAQQLRGPQVHLYAFLHRGYVDPFDVRVLSFAFWAVRHARDARRVQQRHVHPVGHANDHRIARNLSDCAAQRMIRRDLRRRSLKHDPSPHPGPPRRVGRGKVFDLAKDACAV